MDKKISVFCMLAVLALTGCQITDLNADQSSLMAESNNEIGFTTYTGRTVTKSSDLNQSFNVESFLSGASSRTQFFTSTTYKYIDSEYVSDVARYWPANTSQNLDFYAVSPLKYTNTSSTEVELTPASDSTIVVTKTDGTTDIVASRTLNAPNGTAPAVVSLTFGHKLTKVSFTAVGKDTTKKYVITDLKLNANSTSTYHFEASENWGESSDEYRYDYVTDSVTVNNTSKPSSLGTRYLIPKQADNLTASVWYKVYEGNTLIDDHSTTDSVKITLPVKNVWGINKNVVYALTIDIKGNLIEFSPVVLEDWDTVTVISLPQLFSVSATKKVKFTKGNLYCNTTTYPVEWHLEANQYDFRHMNGLAADSASINGIGQKTPVGTVGSFFWSKTASVAYAQTYSDPSAAFTDYFFCDENHKLTVDGQSGLYALSKDEWKYLIQTRTNASTLVKYGVTVNGETNCLIIAPDGYKGTIATTYTAAEWTAAESAGLVCLPPSGYRSGSSVHNVGSLGNYWSSTSDGKSSAFSLFFNNSGVAAYSFNRNCGYSVRLVYSALE